MATGQSAASADKIRVKMDFRSGGWVLLLAGVLVVAIIAWRVSVILPTLSHRAVGDREHIESYGFSLTPLLVPRELVAASGQPKDSWPAMIDPPTIRGKDYDPETKLNDVRKLRTTERVIGVVRNGEARAYPLWVLIWHEAVNDTLGGEPLLVTYSPLCDSAVVFDRRVDGEQLTFGVSGLVFNSNTLLYDRREGANGESLWSQLQFRAIAGPAAARGETLTILPARVMTWAEWFAAQPETTVILPDPRRTRLYKRDAYLPYFGDDRIHFPISGKLPDGIAVKQSQVALRDGESWRVSPASEFDLSTLSPDDIAIWTFSFAWHAMHDQ